MPFFSPANLIPVVGLVLIGALIAFLGRVVRGGNVEILSGYQADKVLDKAGLAAWAGRNLLLLGSLQIASGLLCAVNASIGGTIFFVATLLLAAYTTFGGQRFQR